ncbi:MAG: GNAT family N-acetyltransferase [Gammaproteobacteria bacterium]|nr:MAG: GNAT family N-acetyltransferase [Gammaproteobacteria bacterium]
MLKRAVTDQEIEACFDVMSELRPQLKRQQFLEIVRGMEQDGYRLAGIMDQGRVVAVAGYRIATNLFMGKHLYVDDLVTSETVRSQGYGEQMIQWLRDEAVDAGCNYYHLDSGTHRDQAHKFYFKQGMTIASYHFSEKLG